MMTTYKTEEQKYLYETYANEEGINQAVIYDLADKFSNEVYVRQAEGGDYLVKPTKSEKKFLSQLISSGLWAIKEGWNWDSVASALEYMFVRWDVDRDKRDLNSYLSFYIPFARLCGRGRKVEL